MFRGVFEAEEDDDDDELGRVEASAVPNEVRDWLAQTFTRSTSGSVSKRFTGDTKPRFRSVANAIRAGILVDRQALISADARVGSPLRSPTVRSITGVWEN